MKIGWSRSLPFPTNTRNNYLHVSVLIHIGEIVPMKALQVVGTTVTLLAALSTAAIGAYEPPVTGTPTNDGGSGGRTSVEMILAQSQTCTVDEKLIVRCTPDPQPESEPTRSNGESVPIGS